MCEQYPDKIFINGIECKLKNHSLHVIRKNKNEKELQESCLLELIEAHEPLLQISYIMEMLLKYNNVEVPIIYGDVLESITIKKAKLNIENS